MADSTGTNSPPRGRPRSESARQAILRAAGELLEVGGINGVTAEAIAARASVSKATIYRWWPNKAAVVTDSFLELTAPEIDFVETGSAREDLRVQMHRLARAFSGETGRILAALFAEAQADPDVAQALRTHWIGPRREATRRVLERGVECGELRADLDPGVATDALYGPLYYRLLANHASLKEGFVDALFEHAMGGLKASDSLADD